MAQGASFQLIADKRVWGLHGVLVARGRQIVLERYFEGEDNNWGQALGVVQFGPDTLHNLYSATKSIVALVYGIAHGGQRLYVMPDLDLIIVVMAGNYSAPEQWLPPIRVVREAVLPSLL
jgi:hypothetical protein